MGPWVHLFACIESNEYSNRRVADRQALLRSHVIHNEIALEFVLRDKNYGEKYLPDSFLPYIFLPHDVSSDKCQLMAWQLFQKAKTESL